MPPIRFLLRCGERPGSAGAGSLEPVGGGLAVAIRPLLGDRDLAAMAELAAQSCDGSSALGVRWSADGFRAELTSREGRRVHGWLAWPDGQGHSAPPGAFGSAASSDGGLLPVGMVAVVDVGRKPLVRASIAWLLVHPAARRRGVATALVRRALAEVGRLGGDGVSVETLSSWPAATAFWSQIAGRMELAAQGTGAGHG